MTDPRRWDGLLILVAAVVLFQQVADLALLVPATDFATPAGRVRQLLAVEARSPGFAAADLLLLWALVGQRSRGLRALGVVHLGLGVLLLVLLPFFLVDSASLATGFGGLEASAFRVVVARTLLMLAGLGVAGLWAGRVLLGLRSSP